MYSYGILTLAVLTALLLILFEGVTDRLIPLYAVGAFLAFTLSQAGMVVHWYKKRGPHWGKSAFVNGLGAFVTGIAPEAFPIKVTNLVDQLPVQKPGEDRERRQHDHRRHGHQRGELGPDGRQAQEHRLP